MIGSSEWFSIPCHWWNTARAKLKNTVTIYMTYLSLRFEKYALETILKGHPTANFLKYNYDLNCEYAPLS